MAKSTPFPAERSEIEVWDRFVRVAHWVLAACFATAYLTEGKPQWLHIWSGYAIATILVLRLGWGLVGPRPARFSQFVRGPRVVLAYLRDLLRFSAVRHVGHSPAGGAMIVALMLSLATTAGTGMALLAIRENEGPLAPWLGTSAVSEIAATALGQRKAPKPGRAVKQVHELFANFTLVLVGLHVAGVLFASFAHRENLARAMITGRKRAPAASDAGWT